MECLGRRTSFTQPPLHCPHSSQILAERGAVCVTAVAQDDLGDGSGNPPLPPGAPPSWAGIGLGSLAPLYNPDAFPGGRGGGFAGITAGGGRLRFISAAPAASQLVTPGASGGGGLGGGGQGHFVAEKVGGERGGEGVLGCCVVVFVLGGRLGFVFFSAPLPLPNLNRPGSTINVN